MSYGRTRMPRRRSNLYGSGLSGFLSGFGMFGIAIVLFVILLFVGSITYGVLEHRNVKTLTFTVQDKAIKTHCDSNHSCSSDYMIYTNKGVFTDTDSLWFLKFRSSDLYGNLEKGKTYTCKVYGFRIGLTSTYPNIISCKDE